MRGRVLALQAIVFLGSTPIGGPILGCDLRAPRRPLGPGHRRRRHPRRRRLRTGCGPAVARRHDAPTCPRRGPRRGHHRGRPPNRLTPRVLARNDHPRGEEIGPELVGSQPGAMDEIVGALEAQQAELTGLLEGLDDDGWGRPSPCEGWDVADVVLHLVQTNEHGDRQPRGPARRASTPRSSTAPTARWATSTTGRPRWSSCTAARPRPSSSSAGAPGPSDLADRLRADDPSRRVPWVAGTLSARTLATTRLAETWIHTGDVADALGVELAPTDRLEHIARLAWRTLPYALRAERPHAERPGRLRAHRSRRPDRGRFARRAGHHHRHRPGGRPVRAWPGDAWTRPTTGLVADGPDGAAVLELVRTYA